jgi:hypothetical protein
VFLFVVATAAQAVDLTGQWVGTIQVVVPWCPAETSSSGPTTLVVTQDVDALSAILTIEWNNPENCLPATTPEVFDFEFSGTVDGTSFNADVPFSQVDRESGTVFHFVQTINGSVGEDGVLNITIVNPTDLKHDHYPTFPIDSIFTAQLTRVFPPTASVNSLWPPNHKMVDIGLAHDATSTFIVYSDEDDAGEPDASGSLLLRAERLGTGDGRVYLIAVTAADGLTNTCFTAVVPKSQSPRDIASVNEQAAAAMAQCPSPAGYFLIGN